MHAGAAGSRLPTAVTPAACERAREKTVPSDVREARQPSRALASVTTQRTDVRDESSRHEGHVGERWKSLAKFTKALERHEADRRVSHVDFHCFSSKKASKMDRIGRRGARRARHVSRRTSKCLICESGRPATKEQHKGSTVRCCMSAARRRFLPLW